MRDELPGQRIDPRISLERTGIELGKLPVIPGREVFADLPEVLFDDVEVVDEPLRGRRDRPLFPNGVGDRAIGLEKDAPVFRQTRKERLSFSKPLRQAVLGTQLLRELLEALGRIELRPDGLGEPGKGADGVVRFVRRHVSVVSAATEGTPAAR